MTTKTKPKPTPYEEGVLAYLDNNWTTYVKGTKKRISFERGYAMAKMLHLKDSPRKDNN